MQAEVREVASYEQLERWVAVRNAISLDDPRNLEMMTYVRAHELDRVDLLAYFDGEPVGTAMLAADPLSAVASHPFVELGVLPRYRKRGVGTALLRELSARARLQRKSGLATETVATDLETIAYFGRRGFVERERWRRPSLDLRTLAAEEGPPGGIELVWLGERPDLIGGMYEVAAAVYPELSGYVARQAGALADWQIYELADPSALLELDPVALQDGEVVGFATVLRLDDCTAFQRMVAVRADHRGLGIGRALVLAQAHAARAAGFVHFDASRRAVGEPGLHAELGFVPTSEFVALDGPLLD
jgi:GNAT superfamily N-acetyltransferase